MNMLLGTTFSAAPESLLQRFVRTGGSVLQTLAHPCHRRQRNRNAGLGSTLHHPGQHHSTFFVRRLQAREFFSILSFRLALPRRALVIFFVYAVGPVLWTVHSDMPLLSAVVAVSGFTLALAVALVFAFVSSASFVRGLRHLLPLVHS